MPNKQEESIIESLSDEAKQIILDYAKRGEINKIIELLNE